MIMILNQGQVKINNFRDNHQTITKRNKVRAILRIMISRTINNY